MHELGIAQNIVDIVKQHVPEGQEGLVRTVRLRIGPLSGVIPESLEFCFGAILSGTPFGGAKLEMEHIPLASLCRDCGRESTIDITDFLCPACGGTNIEVTSGTELQVVDIELADDGARDL